MIILVRLFLATPSSAGLFLVVCELLGFVRKAHDPDIFYTVRETIRGERERDVGAGITQRVWSEFKIARNPNRCRCRLLVAAQAKFACMQNCIPRRRPACPGPLTSEPWCAFPPPQNSHQSIRCIRLTRSLSPTLKHRVEISARTPFSAAVAVNFRSNPLHGAAHS